MVNSFLKKHTPINTNKLNHKTSKQPKTKQPRFALYSFDKQPSTCVINSLICEKLYFEKIRSFKLTKTDKRKNLNSVFF